MPENPLLQGLTAGLIGLGDPEGAEQYVAAITKARKEAAVQEGLRSMGSIFARAQEAEDAGNPEWAQTLLRGAMRQAPSAQLLHQAVSQAGPLRERVEAQKGRKRSSEALTGLAGQMREKGDTDIPDNEAAAMAADVLSKMGTDPDKAPEAFKKLKETIQTQWDKVDAGENWVFTRKSDPLKQTTIKKTTLQKLSTGQGTEALVRTEGGKATSIEAQTQPKVTLGEGQSVEGLPGIQLPGVKPQAPAGPVVKPVGLGGIQEAQAGGTTQLVPPRPKRTGIAPEDQMLLRSVGINRTHVEDLSKGEAVQWDTLKRRPGAVSEVKPTAEQAPLLSKMGIKPNQTWGQIHTAYPNAGENFLNLKSQEDAAKVVKRVTEQKAALAAIPYVEAFPASAKIVYNKEMGRRDDSMTLNDVKDGKATLLDPEMHRALTTMDGVLPSLVRLRGITSQILATQPVKNVAHAIALAIQRGAASNEDLARFEALRGPVGRLVARAIERARTSDQDAEAILLAFPTTMDTAQTGVARLDVMIQILKDSKSAALGNPMAPLTDKDLNPGGKSVPGSRRSGGGRFDNRDF